MGVWGRGSGGTSANPGCDIASGDTTEVFPARDTLLLEEPLEPFLPLELFEEPSEALELIEVALETLAEFPRGASPDANADEDPDVESV